MNKIIIGLLVVVKLWAVDVPIDKVKKRVFKENIKINSQVVQLSSATSSIMARLGGKVIKYSVKEGDNVQNGQLIATIESIELASQIAEIKGLQKQLLVVDKNYQITKKLYDIGVESLQKLNQQEQEKTLILSQIDTIKSRLSLIKKRDGNRYKIYTQTAGRVDKILVPLNSIVDSNEPLISIVKGKENFLIKSFIPLKYASKVRVGESGLIIYGDREYKIHITQILPNIDQQTQNMTVLSVLDEPIDNLFVNTFLDSKLFFEEGKNYLTVKKSALSFFNNEWVIFVPEQHEEDGHEEHDNHDKHGHDEHEEVPYDIRVVKILKDNGEFVAIEGLKEHEDYVSDKSYYIKSMLLKSSLGGHGH